MLSAASSTPTESSAVALLDAAPILGNRYFSGLREEKTTRDTFGKSQAQFFHAVGFFSRNLATLTARLPTSRQRAVLVHNLSEEHGLDEENPGLGFRANLAHDRTFSRFLETLGVGDPWNIPPEPPVLAFNLALLGACAAQPPGFAFAALGMIEYAFADISAFIGKRVVDLGWIRADELVHYSLHAEIDKRHAAELFEAAEATGEEENSLAAGLAFGHHIFNRLYEDLIPQKS